MLETLKKEWQAQLALVLLGTLTVWFFVSPLVSSNGRFFGDFPSIYGVMALWGGVWGLVFAKQWGFTRSIMGQAMIYFSLGLFAQEFGQIVYAYFSFFQHIDIPYPSLGDVGYFGSIPLYILGVICLARASGVHFSLQTVSNKIQVVAIPLLLLVFTYFVFLQNFEIDWSDPIRVFLDFGYPLGQAIYLMIAILTYSLTRGVLGGVMKAKILFFIVALFLQYLADFVFLYQAYYETWSAGNFNDYMYLIAYFFMAIALIQLKTVSDKLQHGAKD